MWLTLIGSPVSGSGMRQSSGNSCCRSNTDGELMRSPAERGMVDDVVDALVSEPHLALARLADP